MFRCICYLHLSNTMFKEMLNFMLEEKYSKRLYENVLIFSGLRSLCSVKKRYWCFVKWFSGIFEVIFMGRYAWGGGGVDGDSSSTGIGW